MAAPARILCTGPEIDASVANNEWTDAAKASKMCSHEISYIREDIVFDDCNPNTDLTAIRVCEIKEIDGMEYALIDKDRLPLFVVDGKRTAIDPVTFMLKIRRLNSESANRRRQAKWKMDLLREMITELHALDGLIEDKSLTSKIRQLVRDAAKTMPTQKKYLCDWAYERV